MKKCVIIPDSFKGTISSVEICSIVKGKILEYYPDCDVITIPVADGGEGTVDCFLHAMDGSKISVTVSGPYREKLVCDYARFGGTAVIEMAKAAGLPLVKGRENPALTTTLGVGELMRHAVENGCNEIIVGLGGSCTNDGGTGMAAAMGVKFLNGENKSFLPTGSTLSEIKFIDAAPARELLKDCKITAMCDINNPMFGKTGAAYIFGPQKGADPAMVELLDENLRTLSKQITKDLKVDVSEIPGAGAAGALGAGIAAFLNGELKPGIQTVLDLVDFENIIQGADFIITGEGKIDSQSLRGKVVIGVAERAKRHEIPVVAIVGDVGDDSVAAYDMGVTAIFSINRLAIPFEKASVRSKQDLTSTINDVLRFYKYCARA